MPSPVKIELYYMPRTKYVPNSHLPVIVYRNVLPEPYTEENVTATLEQNRWIKGGAWTAYPKPHFHTNCHECYGVVRGSSQAVIGRGNDDDESEGLYVTLNQGDVIVLPAGVSHCNAEKHNPDYWFVGVYPDTGTTKYIMTYCRDPDQVDDAIELCQQLQPPAADPVFGENGPLMQLWADATVQTVQY